MRKAIFVCAVWISCGIVVGPANAESDRLHDLQLAIMKVVPSGEITVSIANASHTKPLKVWTEANSWGALRWKVVIIRQTQTLVVFEDPDGVLFSKNTPQFDTITPGGHIDRQLNVNGQYWSKVRGGDIHFQPGDRVVVIYDVPPEKEAREMLVWYGVATASTTVN